MVPKASLAIPDLSRLTIVTFNHDLVAPRQNVLIELPYARAMVCRSGVRTNRAHAKSFDGGRIEDAKARPRRVQPFNSDRTAKAARQPELAG